MAFADIWKNLVKKKPKIEDPDATIEFKAGKLKKLLAQVFTQGEKCGEKRQKAIYDNLEKLRKMAEGPGNRDPGDAFMRDFFGMRK